MKHGFMNIVRMIVSVAIIGGFMLQPQWCWGMEGELVDKAITDGIKGVISKDVDTSMIKDGLAETIQKSGLKAADFASEDAFISAVKGFAEKVANIFKDADFDVARVTEGDLKSTLEGSFKEFRNSFGDINVELGEKLDTISLETFKQSEAMSKALDEQTAGTVRLFNPEELAKMKPEEVGAAFKNLDPAQKASFLDKAKTGELKVKVKQFTKLSKAMSSGEEAEFLKGASSKVQAKFELAKIKGTTWLDVGRTLAQATKWVVFTAIAAVVFMWPQFVMQPLQEERARKAQLDTVSNPQAFGGLSLRIPSGCIDKNVPLRSLYVYALTQELPPLSKDGTADDISKLTMDDLFVASGNGNNCGRGSWGVAGIPSGNFAHQMINLGTGYEFYDDGSPVNTKYPYRQLLAGDDTDTMNGCGTTMSKYRQILAGQVKSGAPFEEQLQFLTTAYMAVTPSITPSKMAGDTTLAGKIYDENNSDYLVSAPALDAEIVLPNTITTITLKPLQSMTAQDQTTLFGKQKTAAFERIPLAAYGCFIYQTQDTALLKDLKNMIGADQQSLVQDYVLALMDAAHGYAQVPLKIPFVDNGAVTWHTNPKVKYLYSLIDGSITVVVTGSAPEAFDPILTTALAQPKLDAAGLAFNDSDPLKTALSKDPAIGQQILAMRVFINERKTQGPWSYGIYTITVPKGVSGLNLYMIDVSKNKTTTVQTGENTYASDYLVPLDSTFKPVSLPNNLHMYFVSMITSTIYTRDLVPVTDQITFNLLLYPKGGSPQSQQVFIATPDNIACMCRLGGKDCTGDITAELACQPGTCQAGICDQNQKTSVGKLYWEYELNPYNQDLFWLPLITQKLAESLKSSDDPILAAAKKKSSTTDASKTVWDTMAEYLAAQVVLGIKNALTVSGVRLLLKDLDTAGRDALGMKIANAARDAIIKKLSPEDQKISITSDALAKAKPSEFKNLLQGAFATFGTDVGFEQDTLNNLEQYLWLVGGRTSEAVSLARSGLIPLGAMYIYQNWGLASGATMSKALAGSNAAIDKDIHVTHDKWAVWQAENPVSGSIGEKGLYLFMGPFAFTSKLMPNIAIQATDIDDIKADTFVYTSASYPGDYFIVSSSPVNVPVQTEAFNPINPQPYLISLMNGYIYERQDKATGNLVKMIDDTTGFYRKITNLDALRAGLGGDIAKLLGQAVAESQIPQRYNFGGFELAIDPDDLVNNRYVYQDVSGIDFNTWAQASAQKKLNMVSNFFVTAHKGDPDAKGNTPYTPLKGPIDSSLANCIFSLVTGYSYNSDGSLDRTDIFDTVFGAKKYDNISAAMDARIEALKTTATEAQKKTVAEAIKLTTPDVPNLDATTTKALLDGTKLSWPYASLTFYNGKYYSVDTDLGTILDYAVSYTDTTDSNKPQQIFVGVLYDDSGSPIITYKGRELDLMLRGLGLSVDKAGGESLAIPVVVPDWSMQNRSEQVLQDLKLSVTLDTGLHQGTYDLYRYLQQQGGDLLYAQYTPKDGGPVQYVDLFSGAVHAQPDSKGIAQGMIARYSIFSPEIDPVTKDKTDAIMAFGYDASGNQFMFGPDLDGNYAYWESTLIDLENSQTLPINYTPPTSFTQTTLALSPLIMGQTAAYLWQEVQLKNTRLLLDPNTTMQIYYQHFDASTPPQVDRKNRVEFDVPTGTRGFIEVYEYVGSGATALFTDRDVLTTGSRDPNYDHKLILAYKNGGAKATSLFVPASASALPQNSTLATDSLVECTSTDGVTFSHRFDGESSYTAQLSRSIDGKTKATYITITDNKGTHFYMPRYQTVGGTTLNEIQDKIGQYVSTTTSGAVMLFNPIDTNSLLPIAAVLDKSADQSGGDLNTAFFLYYKGSYFYQYQDSDKTDQEPYYRDASYVDLVSGVLYDEDGKPTGGSLDSDSLRLLLSVSGISVPTPDDDPNCSSGCTVIPKDAKPAKGTPFLVYGA